MKSLESLDKIVEDKLLSSKKNNSSQTKLNLFENNDIFKNRFYFENLTDEPFFDVCGAKNDFMLFYKKILKSNVGCIILGGVYADLPEKNQKKHARISLEESILSKYKQIVLLAHSTKTKVLLKIKSCQGRFVNYFFKNNSVCIGSNYCLKPNNRQKMVLRISDNKCNELVNEIIRIAMLSSISGFDGIMIDATFSNVIGELSSQEFNKRVFGYYSNVNDFLNKTLKAIGKNTFIILKLSVLSLFNYKKNNAGLCEINKTINFDLILDNFRSYINLGVDGFEFVFGREENDFLYNFNGFESELIFEDFIREFREYLNNNQIKNKSGEDILIFYHDNFSDYEKVDNLLKTNIVNMVDVTKDILSDINYLNKIKNAKMIQNCLKCSFCNEISDKKQRLDCLINPKLFDFEELCFSKNNQSVAVIGSGISGLVCALTLANRGFHVDIFEQNNQINHNGKLTTIYGFDKLLENYFNHIESRVVELSKKKMINIFLNQKFIDTKDNLNKYDSIVIATGYKSKFLAVSGAVQNHVINIYDCLENNEIVLKKKNIVIYAKTVLSLKLALYLTENNKKVTIIIKDTEFFKNNRNANMSFYFYKIYKSNCDIYFQSRITKINEDNIDLLVCKNLNSKSIDTMLKLFSNQKIKYEYQLFNIDCDYLIYEPEIISNNKLYVDIVNKKYKGEIYLIGNALECSDLANTIKSGYFVGKNI